MERNLNQCLAFLGLVLMLGAGFFCELGLHDHSASAGTLSLYDAAAIGAFMTAVLAYTILAAGALLI